MGLFSKQFANVVEWEEYRDDIIFWKWSNKEIKKGSKLVIRQGQDAIFMYNGKVEGIFTDEGSFDIESDIIPFLSTLKGFKFGFNSGMRAEVLFINTKIFNVKWGTKNAIRAFGTFDVKVNDYLQLIESLAGIKRMYTVEDIREYVLSMLDPLLMKWITREGKDMFNLQMNSIEIADGIKTDLDMQLIKRGLTCTAFNCSSFTYPKEVQDMQAKAASQSMVGDMARYQAFAVTDAMSKGGQRGTGAAVDMASMQMGMMMGQQMVNNMYNNNMMNQGYNQQMPNQNMNQNQPQQTSQQPAGNGTAPKFCPNCGTPTNGAKFCSECGQKLV